MREYHMKGFLKTAAAGVLAGSLLACPLAGCGSSSVPAEVRYAERPSTIAEVRAGLVSPKNYLDYLYNSMPEAAGARNAGILKGFIYEPSEKELGALLLPLYREVIGDEQEAQRGVDLTVRKYAARTNELCVTVPGLVGVFGAKIPSYMVFTKDFFNSTVPGDAEAAAVARHDLRHVRDWYDGIRLGDTLITYRTLSQSFRSEFLMSLAELRAGYDVLDDFWGEVSSGNAKPLDNQFLGGCAEFYMTQWEKVSNGSATDFEKRIGRLQTDAFAGIVPERRGDGIVLGFNLHGKSGIVTVKRR